MCSSPLPVNVCIAAMFSAIYTVLVISSAYKFIIKYWKVWSGLLTVYLFTKNKKEENVCITKYQSLGDILR